MARISFGDATTFDAIAYGNRNANLDLFLGKSLESASQNIIGMGQQFLAKANEVYERVTSSDAMRVARAVAAQARHMWQSDEIRPLHTTEDIQNAPPKMQRWIMAEPGIRELFHQDQCDGYSDTFVDNHAGDIGEDHYDYRRVMNGICVETEDEIHFTTYFDELEDPDDDLSVEEQADILVTWESVRAEMEIAERDPTSRWNANL